MPRNIPITRLVIFIPIGSFTSDSLSLPPQDGQNFGLFLLPTTCHFQYHLTIYASPAMRTKSANQSLRANPHSLPSYIRLFVLQYPRRTGLSGITTCQQPKSSVSRSHLITPCHYPPITLTGQIFRRYMSP